MGNGSSTGISPLVTVFFNIARVLPAATRFILKAVRSWTKRQSHDIITWFGIDNKLGEAYIHMLDCVKDMLASDEKLLMKMVIEIINIIRSSDNPPSLVDAAGAILVEKHNIFRYKNAFSNSNVESIMSIIMQKGVPTSGLLDQHEQLTESEQMLEKTKAILNTLKNELLEENLVDVFKSHVENNHLLEMYDDLVAFVQSLTDAESIVEDALNAGFQSLQFFVDFSHSSTALVQGGISISLKGLLLLLKNETYEEFEDRVLASFHCGHSTAENFLPGGCSFALHTDDPHNIDGFSLCLGVDPDTTGPLQEISTSCPLTWDPTYCILPHQYSIGITSGHTLPKGVDCCVIIYEISTKTNMEMFSTSSNEESTQLDAAIPSSTMARNSLNPSAYYSNFEWSELRSMSDGNGDTNWITLGWSEDMWDMQCALPQSSNTAFSDLTDVEKEAVRGLGFTPKTWDAPTSMEAWRSVSPNEYWFQYEWDTFLKYEKKLWKKLGWGNQKSSFPWGGNELPPAMKKKWANLTTDEEGAAIKLGFNEQRWYMNSRHFGTANYTFSSEVKFTGSIGRKSFSSAEVRLHRLDGQTRTLLDVINFNEDEEKEYKEFVLQYCEPGDNNVIDLMDSLYYHLPFNSNMYFWRDDFPSFHPGLDTFGDMISRSSLNGFHDHYYPAKENKFWT